MDAKGSLGNPFLNRRRQEVRLVTWRQARAPLPILKPAAVALDMLSLLPVPTKPAAPGAQPARSWPGTSREIIIHDADDIIQARQSAREMARDLGFGIVDQINLASVTSELGRNVYQYSGTGKVTLNPLCLHEPKGLEIVVEDQGPGIPNLEEALRSEADDRGPRGHGLIGTKMLMDEFEVHSRTGVGTRVTVRKWLKSLSVPPGNS
jgi:serine/threonine-protein kinase RsbT